MDTKQKVLVGAAVASTAAAGAAFAFKSAGTDLEAHQGRVSAVSTNGTDLRL
ncbi:hypothetical protein [Sphingomonas hankookensis]|uniref:hypothetical protein n=1 Tax=Sphingomonas hankookensis TaxID=563996 RepID=UPI003F78EFBB